MFSFVQYSLNTWFGSIYHLSKYLPILSDLLRKNQWGSIWELTQERGHTNVTFAANLLLNLEFYLRICWHIKNRPKEKNAICVEKFSGKNTTWNYTNIDMLASRISIVYIVRHRLSLKVIWIGIWEHIQVFLHFLHFNTLEKKLFFVFEIERH